MSQALANWVIEDTKIFGPNVLSCLLISGERKTHLVGCYLPPTSLDDLPKLEAALQRFPDVPPVLLGDLNADLHDLTNVRNQQLSSSLTNFGLFDLLPHFRQRKRF
jgi:hypothetical protein